MNNFLFDNEDEVALSQQLSQVSGTAGLSQDSPPEDSPQLFSQQLLLLSQPQSQQQQHLLSQSQTTTATLQVCTTCGSTAWDVDGAGVATCVACAAQSQGGGTQESTMDYDDIMGIGGRTKRGTLSFHHSRHGQGSRGRTRFHVDDLDASHVLPPLATCLAGLSRVLHQCSVRIASLTACDAVQLHALVGRLWTSYLRAWALGAEYYGKQHATVRLSMRDAFLAWVHRVAVRRTLAERAVHVLAAKADNDSDDKDGGSVTHGQTDASVDEDDSPRPWKRQRTRFQVDNNDNSSDNNDEPDDNDMDSVDDINQRHGTGRDTAASPVTSKPKADKRKTTQTTSPTANFHSDLPWTYRMVAYQAYRQTKGCREAALLLAPSMTLVLVILVTATSRLGITTRQILDWLAAGDLPLWNAYETLLSRSLRTKLTLVRSFFRLYHLPKAHQLERKATLLLLAAGVKSWEAWRGLDADDDDNNDDDNDHSSRHSNGNISHAVEYALPRGSPGLVVSAVPLVLAQCTADLGLGQAVLQTTLSMVGLTAGRVLVPVADITTMAHALAILLCAVIFLEDWQQADYIKGNTETSIPWNENDFGKLANGAAVHKYVEFCEHVVFASTDSVAPEFTDLLHTGKYQAETSRAASFVDPNANALPRVRPCSIAMSAGPQHPHGRRPKRGPLNELVWKALRRKHRRGDETIPRTLPELNPSEALLVEFLAHGTHLARQDLLEALGEILLLGPRQSKKRPLPDTLPIPSRTTQL